MSNGLLGILMGIVLGFNSGCATLIQTPPKETVRAIFTEVKNRNYEQAQRLYDQTPNGTGYEVYEGGSAAFGKISAQEMDKLFGVAGDFLRTCEELVEKVKDFPRKQLDEDHEGSGAESVTLAELKDKFKAECEFQNKEYRKDELNKIKKYSTVDLLAEVPGFRKAFYTEIHRIESGISKQRQIEEKAIEDEKSKKAAYESSPAFYSKKLCEMQAILNAANSVIAREKEAGEISGFVDKNKMYEAGRAVTINRNRIKHFSSEYQSKFGKSWSASECK